MTGETILLVEDHAQLRSILAAALASLNFEVICATNADEAMCRLQQGLEPDILITDIRMPGSINGLDLARWTRAHRPNCRILLQTGYSDVDAADFEVLRKPYSNGELMTALGKSRK